MTKTPPDELVKQWKAEWTRMPGDNPYYFTRDKFIAAKTCEWQREQIARTEKAAQDAIDHALVIALDRTLDSYANPAEAMNALCVWHESVGAFFQRERDAALEPEIPADIKGRVQAEWFWKGVLAMKAAIKQQEKSE